MWTYSENSSGFGTSSPVLNTLITAVAGAFGGVSGGGGEQGAIYNGVDGALTAFGTGGNRGDAAPSAYLNYILFDKDYNVLDMGWTPATGYNAQKKISIDDIAVTEPGYIFVYLSYENESGNFVQFDDFKVTHTMTNVIQYNEYYPFGLQASTSWTRENNKNNYLYNAGNELNDNSGVYETFFRGYDPALGRFLQLDPLASMYSSHSGYNYALNNPVLFNDPMGDRVISELPDYADQSVWDGGGYRRNGPGSGNHWTDSYRGVEGNAAIMSSGTFNSYYGISSDNRAAFANSVGSSVPSSSFGAIASAYNNDGGISIGNGFINLFYCDCNAQVQTHGYGGDPVETSDGGNIVRGWNNIIDVEFEFTRTGVGQSGPWEGLIPVWGYGRNAIDDWHYGDYGHSTWNALLAISDLLLVRAAAGAVAKGIGKLAANVTVPIYRVYGGGASMYGKSYSLINPNYVPYYRNFAGLPNANTGQYLLRGNIPLNDIRVGRWFAAPLDGRTGGLPFELYQNFNQLSNPANILLKQPF